MQSDKIGKQNMNTQYLVTLFSAITGYEGPNAAHSSAQAYGYEKGNNSDAELLELIHGQADNVYEKAISDEAANLILKAIRNFEKGENVDALYDAREELVDATVAE